MQSPQSSALFSRTAVSEKLIESRCQQCGLIVAASHTVWILTLAESQHTCPVYLNYDFHSRPQPAS